MTRKALPLLAALAFLAAAAGAEEPAAAPKADAAKAADAKPVEAKADSKPALPGMAPAPACLVNGPAADGKGCAGAYKGVAEGYLEAYKAMDRWVSDASAQVAGASDKVAGLEKSIRDNESTMTNLKLERTPEAKAKLKELDKENRRLWRDLEGARREEAKLCKDFSRSAAQKVRELNADVQQRLQAAQKQGQ